MKKHLLLMVALFVLCMSGFAQGYVYFGYDANGNRISRSIFFGKVSENSKDIIAGNELVPEVNDQIGGTEYNLYPNPTRGQFSVSVADAENQAPMRVILYSQSGDVLVDKTLSGNVEEFDLSSQSAGFYLLKLIVGEESKTWKVVKY